jgi:hypothetical protein
MTPHSSESESCCNDTSNTHESGAGVDNVELFALPLERGESYPSVLIPSEPPPNSIVISRVEANGSTDMRRRVSYLEWCGDDC